MDNEKGRQECLPHLHTHFLSGPASHYAAVELIDSRIKQLTVTIHELIRLSHTGSFHRITVRADE